MAVTGYKTPGTAASADRDGKAAWADPNNAKAQNNNRAIATVETSTYSDWLRLTNFGFTAADVPTGATIDGIELVIERQSASAAKVTDSAIYLIDSASSHQGDNKAGGDGWNTSDEEATYGGAADTWNAGLDQVDIVSANFGIDISAANADSKNTQEARIDYVKIRIYYTPTPSPSESPSESPSVSPSASISPSASVSPSPSPGYQGYTRGDPTDLPSDDNALETAYSGQDITDVSADDGDRVGQAADTGKHAIHQYKDWVGGASSCDLEWNGQTNEAATWATVYLQIYNYDTPGWETVDSNNTANADTDFTLSGNIADLTNYKSGGVICCRIYQEAV